MTTNAAITEEAAEAVGVFFGLPPLAAADLGDLAITIAVFMVTILVVRLLSNRLHRWLERSIVPRFGTADDKPPLRSKHTAAASAAVAAVAVLIIVAAAHDWPPYSKLLFDLAIPLASALAVWRLALAFNLAGSAALAIAVICGLWALTSRYERLDF
ncbi:MAG TPA: hypothetical protein VMK31_02525, partial [Sphingomicrobium sp.]|nr:hypothetical protein [Sphingomicrobium sp.]